MLDPATPVIVGVGQSLDRIDAPDYRNWSAADLAAAAARVALHDAGGSAALLASIDAIATTRTFEDSRAQPAPFGKSGNFPRSVARRLGIDPRYALWSKGGGNSPQDLVGEFAARIAAGEFNAVLICGGEAISTVRHAVAQGRVLDFAEDPGGTVEDRGAGTEDFIDAAMIRYGIANPPLAYGIAENARRARLGLTREAYAREMGRLFAPFAAVAYANPLSAWRVPAYAADELVTPGPHNRWIAAPYPLRLVARDQVNQGAAVLMTPLGVARDLAIADDRMVYLHGHARAVEKPFLGRPDLGASPAARAATRLALDHAGAALAEFAAFDFYSCFPVAVSNVAIDELGLSPDDDRKLTVTGGLPFFGGPGNNYSMHAIAEMVARVRTTPGRPGMVGANGGYLSKYSVGIYSAELRAWRDCDSASLQSALDAVATPPLLAAYAGEAVVESYTVQFARGEVSGAVVIGRTMVGERFIARTAAGDLATAHAALRNDPIGRPIQVTTDAGLNSFTFA